ncbi:hypothetical protein [Microcystis aeruginosa]|jgi:putative protein kinase ArgK-like GTPase of G3E family|uniref:HD domain-containing protein n=1 Tax=Microcystis aeruginosa Ma_QC_C_20070703_M131 TaxID=2486263 RepID=A0A551XB38_MICAE|nr:hypothetical protein [Microcystis aeruginosa]MDB9392901.1 hypothetical protein [Microcystis aeruginosa CS-579]TRT45953.1 MAG: hypothetical protein EWV85_19010 [Microcystis aeruginosa Ma_QC_C_20070703_M131]
MIDFNVKISRPPHGDRTQTVKEHLIETGAIAVDNLRDKNINQWVILLAEIAGKWHDIGKLDYLP